jgi:hypothetical protein
MLGVQQGEPDSEGPAAAEGQAGADKIRADEVLPLTLEAVFRKLDQPLPLLL